MFAFKPTIKIHQIQNMNVTGDQTNLHFKQLHQYFTKQFTNSKTRDSIYTNLLQGIKHQNWIIKLKYSMLLHYVIQNFQASVLIQTFITECEKKYYKNHKQSNSLQYWIENEIIKYYESYILKCCVNYTLFNFCKQIKIIQKVNINLQLISNGFKAINLIRYIKQTNQNFNKLGRYYPDYHIIQDLFKMYIDDYKIYYNFLILLIDSILEYYTYLDQELLTHAQTLINSFIEVCDQMFEFCYNRYYYKNMKNYYIFPSIYNLDNIKYNKMIDHINKCYPKKNSESRSKSCMRFNQNNNHKLLNCKPFKKRENQNKYNELYQFLQATIFSRNDDDEHNNLFNFDKENLQSIKRM